MRKAQMKVGSLYKVKVDKKVVGARLEKIEGNTYTILTSFQERLLIKTAAPFLEEVEEDFVEDIVETSSDDKRQPLAESNGVGNLQPSTVTTDNNGPATLPLPQPSYTPTELANGPAVTPFSRALRESVDRLTHPSTQPPHLIIEARAGTGKTTTLVEGLKLVKGLPVSITPSPQQSKVWEQMALSKGVKTVCFVAFNKSIATELQRRVPHGCDAMTMHSMGFKAVNRAFGRQEPNSYVVMDIIAELLERDIRQLRADPKMVTVLKATEELVDLCKMKRRRVWKLDGYSF